MLQLRSWFRWRQSALTHATRQRQTIVNITNLLTASSKGRTQALTAVEKYSNMFYHERVAATVQTDLDRLGVQRTHSQVLTTIKRVTKEIWEAEDDTTKSIVLEALAADKADKSVVFTDGEIRTPAEYQR